MGFAKIIFAVGIPLSKHADISPILAQSNEAPGMDANKSIIPARGLHFIATY